MNRTATLLACCAGAAVSASGQTIIGDNENVIITEVMFNPAGAEAETEWVEITNIGPTPVDITRYAIDDEDGSSPSHMFGAGAIRNVDGTVLPESSDPDCLTVDIFGGQGFQCDPDNTLIIQPGESIIVSSFWDPRSRGFGSSIDNGIENTFDAWVAAWGDDTDSDGFGDTVDFRIVFLLTNITIANTGSPINEVLDLIEYEQDGTIVSRDYVNYEVGNSNNQWPFSSNGLSFYLQPNFLADAAAQTAGGVPPANGSLDNSNQQYGVFWSNSAAGRDLARNPFEVMVQDMDAGPNGDGLDANGDPIMVTLVSGNDAGSPGVVPGLGDSFEDANGNGRDDVLDIFLGSSEDCNRNRIPDEVEADCNGNGLPDDCEFQISQEEDCDGNGSPDNCDIAFDGSLDLDGNGVLDICENTPGFGDIVITEIMFNPSGSEGGREYLEIINTGSGAVDLTGAFFQDLDQPVFDGAEPSFPTLVVQPGEVVVFGETSIENFTEGWGDDTDGDGLGDVLSFTYFNIGGIAMGNNADLVNEVRSLLAANGVRIDVANYQSTTSNGVPQGGWPGDFNGTAYYLFGTEVDPVSNNDGGNWGQSIRNLDGARSPLADSSSDTYWDPDTIGSPGTVNLGSVERPIGDVIISEVHFASNTEFPGLMFPDPTNGIDEWVEIVNVSASTVDLGGWFLEDEDGRTSAIPAGVSLAPGEALVLTANDFPAENPMPVSEFYDAWNCGFQVITLQNWYNGGLGRLSDQAEGPGAADSPSGANEILQLRDGSDMVQDIVNYDDDGFDWPLVSNGLPFTPAFSIYLFRSSDYNELDNDEGLNWATSLVGFDGAIQNNITPVYNTTMFGSPGFVDGITVNFDPQNCISDDPILPRCADQNRDGEVTPADFNSWIINFNNNDPIADVNQDGAVTPADFNAWILAFNQGANGPLCPGT